MLNNFHSDHLTDLQKSGLSDESILSAGIATVPRGEIYKRLGYDPQGLKSMYEIPYVRGFPGIAVSMRRARPVRNIFRKKIQETDSSSRHRPPLSWPIQRS